MLQRLLHGVTSLVLIERFILISCYFCTKLPHVISCYLIQGRIIYEAGEAEASGPGP